MFTQAELKESDNEKPNKNILKKLTRLTESMWSSTVKITILEVLKTTEGFVDFDGAFLHLSPAKSLNFLQPRSCSKEVRESFLREYPDDIESGLKGTKLKNWVARTRPTVIVHVVDNDGLSVGLNSFSFLVVGIALGKECGPLTTL